MSLITNWGYLIPDVAELSGMISLNEFNAMTANKYCYNDIRLKPLIDSASAAVRNYCGWHLFPPATCVYSDYLLYGNGRIKQIGNDLLIQLPAAYVAEVQSIQIGDEEYTDFAMETNGIIHVFDVSPCLMSRKTKITVCYTAGLPEGMMAGIKELIADRVIHGVSGTGGISSETAGGVSVSYANSWVNGGGAGAISSMDAEILSPYRLGGVF